MPKKKAYKPTVWFLCTCAGSCDKNDSPATSSISLLLLYACKFFCLQSVMMTEGEGCQPLPW